MKLAVIYQAVFPSLKGGSGGDRRVRDLTKGLAVENEVEMLVPAERNFGQPNPDSDEFKVTYLGKKGNVLVRKYGYWTKVIEYCKKEKFDGVLFYNTTFESVPVMKRIKKNGTFVFYEICDEHSASLSGFEGWRNKYAENNLPKNSELNITISDYLAGRVKEHAPEVPVVKVPILYDGNLFFNDEEKAKETRRNFNIDANDVVFGYAGGTWKEEGIATLLESFSILLKEYDNIKLIVAGKLTQSERHDDIEGFVKRNNLSDQIITPGWVDTEMVRGIYSAADILCLPQIQHGFNVAGLPTKLAEYASIGKAILATGVGDVPQYFKNNESAMLYPSGDQEEMLKVMRQLIDDKSLRQRLGQTAKIVSEANFDYRNAGKKISKKLRELIEKKES